MESNKRVFALLSQLFQRTGMRVPNSTLLMIYEVRRGLWAPLSQVNASLILCILALQNKISVESNYEKAQREEEVRNNHRLGATRFGYWPHSEQKSNSLIIKTWFSRCTIIQINFIKCFPWVQRGGREGYSGAKDVVLQCNNF